jgi:hypothetical protein
MQMTTIFNFDFQQMLQWYVENWNLSPYLEPAEDAMRHVHIHVRAPYQNEKRLKKRIQEARKSPQKKPADAGNRRRCQQGVFLRTPHRDQRVARFRPSALLPFLDTRPEKYPLGMYAVLDPASRAIYMVYPQEKTNEADHSAVFADYFSFAPGARDASVIALHRMQFLPSSVDLETGFADSVMWNAFPDGTELPREGYATGAFAKMYQYQDDVLDLARLHVRAPPDDGGGRSSPAAAAATAAVPVSARLERVLLRHGVCDVKLFGVAVPATGTWHYTCYVDRAVPNPMLQHDLAFQARDGSWRAAQHALLRRFRALEETYEPLPPGLL